MLATCPAERITPCDLRQADEAFGWFLAHQAAEGQPTHKIVRLHSKDQATGPSDPDHLLDRRFWIFQMEQQGLAGRHIEYMIGKGQAGCSAFQGPYPDGIDSSGLQSGEIVSD